MKKKFDPKLLSPKKVHIDEILAFAEEALQDPEIVSILEQRIFSPPVIDEETEILEAKLSMKVGEHLEKKCVSWKLQSAYKDALQISSAIMRENILGIDDPAARDILKNSPFIDFGVKK